MSDEWISVKDRLPEVNEGKSDVVLVVTEDWFMFCAYWNGDFWIITANGSYMPDGITHWQLLPAPPPGVTQ